MEALLRLVESADVLIEGYRPGVAERLGVGPQECHAVNPRLVFGRMTGWGQDGPLSKRAGHDINYIALTGALEAIGSQDGAPQVPLNLVGDYGGGSTYLVMGVLAALLARVGSGRGQVVDAAIVDGTAHSLAGFYTMLSQGRWCTERGSNLLDGSRPYYGVYKTRDGRYMAVGAIEKRFYAELLTVLDISDGLADREDPANWPEITNALAARFLQEDQDHWTALFLESDACVTPVLNMKEAFEHPHLQARGTLTHTEGVLQPAKAPRFSDWEAERIPWAPDIGQHSNEDLQNLWHAR